MTLQAKHGLKARATRFFSLVWQGRAKKARRHRIFFNPPLSRGEDIDNVSR